MKTAAIVQARFGSTRLPGKILKELSGKPMLWHVVDRLSRAESADAIIIATTNLPEDDRIENFCKENNILFYRGDSEDVLSRYFEAAESFGAENIIRITSDCPLIDPAILDSMTMKYFAERESMQIDYMSNVLKRTFPRGLDAEIFTFEALAKAHLEASSKPEREHVTPYIYNNPVIFRLSNFENEKDFSFYRWTVDTQEDFELIKRIYDSLYTDEKLFLFNDVLKLFNDNPGLIGINQNIKQKELGE